MHYTVTYEIEMWRCLAVEESSDTELVLEDELLRILKKEEEEVEE